MSLSKSLKQREVLNLEFEGVEFAPTYDGNDTVFTFGLVNPITKIGSTIYNDLSTQTRDVRTKVTDAVVVHIMEKDLDAAESEFVIEDQDGKKVIIGYKGDKLVLDVSKPKYNQLNGEQKQPCKLWLRTVKFSETPRMTMKNPSKSMTAEN